MSTRTLSVSQALVEFLANQLIRATHRVERLQSLNPVIYCTRDIYEWLDIQAANRTLLLR